MPLTDSQIRKVRPSAKTTKFADGGGLTLLVTPKGSKLWRLRYRYDGKQKDLALGRYPAVSLARARERREEPKILLAQGIDPRAAQIEAKAERLAVTENTFGKIADELLAKLRAEGVAEVTLSKKQWLLDIARLDIGSRPIRDLTSAMVLETLRKVEKTGRYEKANRLRSTIGQGCRYAISTARLDNDPTAALKGALVSPTAKHQAAITDKVGFEGLVRDLWGYEGSISTQVGLKLLVLIYPRPGELRRARWTEFDLDAGTWTIPPEHEKNRRQHVKPLPQTAIELLRRQHEYSGQGEYVLPTTSTLRKPLSENALNQALHRLGYKGRHTSHGFRASASSFLNESGHWNVDAIETELGHMERNQSRRPYNRARYWEERVQMADWWDGQVTRLLHPPNE